MDSAFNKTSWITHGGGQETRNFHPSGRRTRKTFIKSKNSLTWSIGRSFDSPQDMTDAIRTELTEEEKKDYVFDHIAELESGSGVIFCPWCHKVNNPTLPVCCQVMQETRTEYGRGKLLSIETQLRAVLRGRSQSIKCPYCGVWNKKLEKDSHPSEWTRPMVNPFCCNRMSDAATAIVERMTLNKLIEDKKRIEDGVQK